jgi:hypothetical protein
MFINIITPCSRPENLLKIAESINIPIENCRWIIVFDADEVPKLPILDFINAEFYAHKNIKSCVGHSQRNFALNLINDGYVYSLDDDTLLHKELWESIKNLNSDFISFNQAFKDGSLRLKAGRTDVGYIDSHNFLLKRTLIGDTRFEVDDYNADGVFADACAKKTNDLVFIDKTLSVYNILR